MGEALPTSENQMLDVLASKLQLTRTDHIRNAHLENVASSGTPMQLQPALQAWLQEKSVVSEPLQLALADSCAGAADFGVTWRAGAGQVGNAGRDVGAVQRPRAARIALVCASYNWGRAARSSLFAGAQRTVPWVC